jgi:hypothetical protein
MLDEGEYKTIQDAYRAGALEVKKVRVIENRPLNESDENDLYGKVAARYREITGVSDVPPREILRHRLSLVGPPCENCGKELRTPQARKCVECGQVRESVATRPQPLHPHS